MKITKELVEAAIDIHWTEYHRLVNEKFNGDDCKEGAMKKTLECLEFGRIMAARIIAGEK